MDIVAMGDMDMALMDMEDMATAHMDIEDMDITRELLMLSLPMDTAMDMDMAMEATEVMVMDITGGQLRLSQAMAMDKAMAMVVMEDMEDMVTAEDMDIIRAKKGNILKSSEGINICVKTKNGFLQ